jgi:NAD(P) transhydrogenase subunit alpha
MVQEMKSGSIIVDLATEAGGNCHLSELDQVVVKHGVTLIGYSNMPARIPVDSSALLSRNLVNFLTPMMNGDSGDLSIDWDDEVISGTLATKDGEIVHPMLKDEI